MGFQGVLALFPINNYIKLGLIPTIYIVRKIIKSGTRWFPRRPVLD